MDEKMLLNRADMAVAQMHLDFARHHRYLASEAMERIRKRQRPDIPVDEDFDPFDEEQVAMLVGGER